MLSLLVAIAGQYWYYDYMTDIPGAKDAWTENCKDSSSSYPRCREYATTERVSFAAACFFAFMAMLSGFMPPIHDHGWDIKVPGVRDDRGSWSRRAEPGGNRNRRRQTEHRHCVLCVHAPLNSQLTGNPHATRFR